MERKILMIKTIRLTMAQALLKFIDNQYIEMDGKEYKFVKGIFGIFGHGNVTGLGEALEYSDTQLTYLQGHNEQGMAHAAIAYAKQKNRLQMFACTSSIGPGALNMVTAAATATINRIPLLLLPGDIFACRQPDPVLQQIEITNDYTITSNDCFKPVSKFWDRITRPEQLMISLINAFRVLTDPVETGTVTLCLPQDVQAEAYEYPATFFSKRIHHIDRRPLTKRALETAVDILSKAKNPLIIAGGGVHYALACHELTQFATTFSIPVAETQAGKSAMNHEHPMSVGGIGVTGTLAANLLAQNADVILVIGSRLSDFTTTSKSAFKHHEAQFLNLNVNAFDGYKMDGVLLQADAKEGLVALQHALLEKKYSTSSAYQEKIQQYRHTWHAEVEKLYQLTSTAGNCQTQVLGILNQHIDENAIIVCAAGSLPGDLHRLWRCKHPKTYHLEYGFSCMGYEVAGGLGVKMANPEAEVYVIVGDGSYLMMHSELLTALQEGYKINIIILNNNGYQCINNLQRAHGSQGFGNEFRHRDKQSNRLSGENLAVNFSQYALSLGAIAHHANNAEELKSLLLSTKNNTRSTVITIDVLPNTMSPGYESWWRVGVAEVSTAPQVLSAHAEMQKKILTAKSY
jgi:3D-(3,5/4)-trihydroxycyclohexane-1,2-dione acylhydrolase (decyclizing)